MTEHCTRGCKRTDYQRNSAVLGLVLLIVVGGITFASAQTSDAFVPGSLYNQAELMPYPTLTVPLSLCAEGRSREFTCSQEIQSASSGVAILNWTHTPGVELQYSNSSYSLECLEYAYVAENISWSRNVRPTALEADVYLQAKETGSFQTHTMSPMFYVEIWILGDTIQRREVAGMSPVQGYQHFSASVFDYQVFDALIQYPESHLQLAFALVPTSSFWEYQGSHPWMTYSGSVEIVVMEMHLKALYRTSADMPRIRTPTFNNTWRLGEYDDYFVDSCMAGDNSLYILSHQQYSNSLQEEVLAKFNPKGEIVWRTILNNTNSFYWSRVLATSHGALIVGTYYYSNSQLIEVDKIGEDGVQSHAFCLNCTDVGYLGDMDIGPDGCLYIATYSPSGSKRNTLRKTLLDGTIIWEESFGDDYYGSVSSVQIDENGNVFTFSHGQVTKWNSEGQQLWQLNNLDKSFPGAKSLYVLRDGSSIIIASEFTNSTVVCLSPNGGKVWSFTDQIEYAPDWSDAFNIPWITEGPSGRLYALYTTYYLHHSSTVIVMNREGLQLDNFTASFGKEPYTYLGIPRYLRVYVNDENMMYLVGRVEDKNGYDNLALVIYPGEPGVLGGREVALLSTSAAIGLILGVLVYVEHCRKHRIIN